MESDRDLLVGLTALGNGLLGPGQFLQACALCRKQGSLGMSEVLAKHGWVSEAQKTQVEHEVDRLIHSKEGHARHALLETLRSLELASLQRNVAHEETMDVPFRTQVDQDAEHEHEDTIDHRSESGTGHVLIDTLDYRPENRSRYTLTTVHGKGGLGQVWLAFDQDLNREVALKEIRPDRRKDRDAMRRLISEAQITGQLEHPNIIPVYELTKGPKEQPPFYTMRFLRGNSLREAIQEYHREQNKGTADPMQMRVLLNAFVGICNAVAYAASRGIVHRDLKPDNVMLGAFGEVLVLDWGLARSISQEEPDDENREIQITSDPQEPTQTLDGQIVGSPAYMAPEQAQGRLAAIDARTDVYGLGSILFSILTDHAPHRATDSVKTAPDTMEILKKITTDPTPEPLSVSPRVPRALNAVCAKAMRKRRSERYQTALELADDVQRWLADEPVSAHPDPWSDRLARWMRHHRAWTQAAALVLVSIAIVSTIATFLVNGARQEEAAAKGDLQVALDDVQAAREEATRRFQETRETVDRSLTGVANVLQFYPSVGPLRIKLLEQAALDYERFAAERSDDPALQLQTARAMIRLGDVRGWLQQWQAAIEQYEGAETFLQTLAAEYPDRDDYQLHLAECRAHRGFALFSLGRFSEAEAAYRGALDVLEDAPADVESQTDWRIVEAGTLSRLAELQGQIGKLEEAISLCMQAEAILAPLADASDDAESLTRLAAVRNQQGQLLRKFGRLDEAESILQKAITDYLLVQIRDEDQPAHIQGVAECQLSLANVLSVLGRENEAEKRYRDAIAQLEILLETIPDAPRYRESIASTRRQLAQMLLLQGNNPAARGEVEKALDAFIDLVSELRDVHQYHVGQAASTLTYGFVLRDLDDDEHALMAATSAIGIFDELCAASPEVPEYRVNLAVCRGLSARVYQKQGQHEDAVQSLLAAIEDLKAARQLQEEPSPLTQDALATTHTFLGDALRRAGRTDEATASYRRSLEIRELLTEQNQHRFNLAWLLIHCGELKLRQPERAVTQAKELVRRVPDNGRFHSLLGMAHFRDNNFEASLVSLREAISKRPHEHSADWFFLAMVQWKMGQKEEALKSYQAAVQRMDLDQPGNLNAALFRAEAAELLGVQADAEETP